MKRTISFLIVIVLAIMVHVPRASQGAATLPVACSPDKPAVLAGDSVRLRVWVEAGDTLSYDWEVSAGKVRGSGREVTWEFAEVRPGTYTAIAYVAYPTGQTEKCSVQVLVEQTEARGGITGWSLLLSGAKEKPGYGLYSYILFGSRPTGATRDRYLKALEAYVSLMESIASLEAAGIAPHRLNITYVPVSKNPPPKERPSAEWLLAHYDYARARAILSILPGPFRSEGPYIISHLKPLSAINQLSGKYLYQDLSLQEPKVIYGYAREFFNQAAQERYWEEKPARQLALKLQNTISLMARALPDVRDALKVIGDLKGTITWVE